MSVDDPFDTASLREAVLDAWQSSPTRFREDSNAEEDLVLGGYRDRLIVELIQNALDAAAPNAGHVRISVTDQALIVANSGRPITREGVVALASLRASSKRDETSAIGRFGVGFASVLAITDAPLIVSTSGSVAFSLGRTRSLVGAIPGLGSELMRREGRVPVLRLPFTPHDIPGDLHHLLHNGWATVIRLPFRDAEARELTLKLIDELDPGLPVVLDGFGELELDLPDREERIIRRTAIDSGGGMDDIEADGVRWRLEQVSGNLDAILRDERSIEDRGSRWSALAAVPIDSDGVPMALPEGLRQVVRAPQETQEELSVPIVVSATYPLDADRRRIRPGAIADVVTGGVADAVIGLMERVAPGRAMLDLVASGLPKGELDASLREQIERRLPTSRVLPDGSHNLLDLGHATMPTAALLREVEADFLPGDWPATHPAYSALGVVRIDTRRFVDWLVESGPRPEPRWWARLVAALSDCPDKEALAGLPVPLADGAFSIGTRGVLLPESGLDVSALTDAGVELRVLHPEAVDPAWASIGVELATAPMLLEDDRLRQAVEDEVAALREDEIEPSGALGLAVLELVGGSGVSFANVSWLQDVVLAADDGSMWPAADLLMPGSPLAEVVEDPVIVSGELIERFGRDAVLALGVADRFVVTSHEEGEEIRDLDLVRDDAWGRTLELLAVQPDTRRALLDTSRGKSAAAQQVIELARINGLALPELVVGSDPLLAALFDPLPVDLDEEVAAALEVISRFSELDSDKAWDALDRVGLASTNLERASVRRIYGELVGLASVDGESSDPPLSVKAVRDGVLVTAPTADTIVIDSPDLLPLIGERPYVPVALSKARGLAAVLRVPLASSLAPFTIATIGQPAECSGHPYLHHERLMCDDIDGNEREVEWRLVDGEIHASTLEGVGRALALREQRWDERAAVIARLRSVAPDADGDFDEG